MLRGCLCMANALSMQHDGQSSAAHSSPSMNDASTQGDSRNKNGSIHQNSLMLVSIYSIDMRKQILPGGGKNKGTRK